MEAENLKVQILELVKKYYQTAHQKSGFEPGKSRINYSGRVYDDQELVNLVDSSLDFWLTAGPYGNKFESKMRDFFSSRDFLLVNSGSSANLLMVSTICSPELKSQKDTQLQPLEPGDEVITPAVTFPTTLAPIIQNRLIPVFVDCEVGTYNINPHLIEDAVGPRTKAIFIPHTVGNPCNMEIIMDVAKRHNLWVLEDSCDALGATFDGTLVGTFGQMASLSFYPAHHMTMGEGGAVIVNQASLKKTVLSLRDWGRSCWCPPGISDSCSKRFNWELGELPFGYDHKYIYSNIGYNLKVTDMQAAIGIAQKEKVEGFIEKRRHNFWRLYEGLKSLGAGFLGYYLVKSALFWNQSVEKSRKIDLTVYDNYIRGVPSWLTDLEENSFSLVKHDITQPLPSNIDDFQYIIHAASIASPTYYRKYPIETMDANVNGLRFLLEYCQQKP